MTVPENGNPRGVTAEAGDVVAYPMQGSDDIKQSIVTGCMCITRTKKSWNNKR